MRKSLKEHLEGPRDINFTRHVEGVPVHCQFEEHMYRPVLRDYEEYMLLYESLAPRWTEHYGKMHQVMDRALGLDRTDDAGSTDYGKIREAGPIAMFGCGFNVIRELSPALQEALRKGETNLVLVDFSRIALTSSINLLANIGITPQAAYQMDLTRGLSSEVNVMIDFIEENKDEKWSKPKNDDEWLDWVEYEIDGMIEAFDSKMLSPYRLKNPLMEDKDVPGTAVTTMVSAATFLTMYGRLLGLVNSLGGSKEKWAARVTKIQGMHAKYNAMILKMNAEEMARQCRGKGEVLIISDINKVDLGLVIDGKSDSYARPDGEVNRNISRIRGAVESFYGDGEGDWPEGASEEVRMSRDGNRQESLEDIIRGEIASKHLPWIMSDVGDSSEWVWWDEMDHGHRVQEVRFSVKNDVFDVLEAMPEEIVQKGSPEEAADYLKRQFGDALKMDRNPNMVWLKNLKISEPEVESSVVEGRRPFMLQAAAELLDLVPDEILEQGWDKADYFLRRELLPKHKRWNNDGFSMDHVRTGFYWLKRFVERLSRDD